MSSSFVERVDPEVYSAIENERRRQVEKIELIASENYTSAAVLEAVGSVLTNKYAEGYPGGVTTADASGSTSPRRSRSSGRRRSSAPLTRTCSPTRVLRRTWPPTPRS